MQSSMGSWGMRVREVGSISSMDNNVLTVSKGDIYAVPDGPVLGGEFSKEKVFEAASKGGPGPLSGLQEYLQNHNLKLTSPEYIGKYGQGQTALHVAIERRNFDQVKLLVQKGADVQAKASGAFFQLKSKRGF
ncbi:hypothetical protein NHX12_008526 [Muraenolepis orangiensis]|uniref:Uncharacterized protein n=1 Tax=Muraenolepis orangiensis TaxID=630683 RepID=A0A9Q0IBC2_9TELE|nr:hypothetical protein NHX12_008526 [Muraenolepis orangiensis]